MDIQMIFNAFQWGIGFSVAIFLAYLIYLTGRVVAFKVWWEWQWIKEGREIKKQRKLNKQKELNKR